MIQTNRSQPSKASCSIADSNASPAKAGAGARARCTQCGVRLSLFLWRRRHRCYHCGGIFCARCTSSRVLLPSPGIDFCQCTSNIRTPATSLVSSSNNLSNMPGPSAVVISSSDIHTINTSNDDAVIPGQNTSKEIFLVHSSKSASDVTPNHPTSRNDSHSTIEAYRTLAIRPQAQPAGPSGPPEAGLNSSPKRLSDVPGPRNDPRAGGPGPAPRSWLFWKRTPGATSQATKSEAKLQRVCDTCFQLLQPPLAAAPPHLKPEKQLEVGPTAGETGEGGPPSRCQIYLGTTLNSELKKRLSTFDFRVNFGRKNASKMAVARGGPMDEASIRTSQTTTRCSWYNNVSFTTTSSQARSRPTRASHQRDKSRTNTYASDSHSHQGAVRSPQEDAMEAPSSGPQANPRISNNVNSSRSRANHTGGGTKGQTIEHFNHLQPPWNNPPSVTIPSNNSGNNNNNNNGNYNNNDDDNNNNDNNKSMNASQPVSKAATSDAKGSTHFLGYHGRYLDGSISSDDDPYAPAGYYTGYGCEKGQNWENEFDSCNDNSDDAFATPFIPNHEALVELGTQKHQALLGQACHSSNNYSQTHNNSNSNNNIRGSSMTMMDNIAHFINMNSNHGGSNQHVRQCSLSGGCSNANNASAATNSLSAANPTDPLIWPSFAAANNNNAHGNQLPQRHPGGLNPSVASTCSVGSLTPGIGAQHNGDNHGHPSHGLHNAYSSMNNIFGSSYSQPSATNVGSTNNIFSSLYYPIHTSSAGAAMAHNASGQRLTILLFAGVGRHIVFERDVHLATQEAPHGTPPLGPSTSPQDTPSRRESSPVTLPSKAGLTIAGLIGQLVAHYVKLDQGCFRPVTPDLIEHYRLQMRCYSAKGPVQDTYIVADLVARGQRRVVLTTLWLSFMTSAAAAAAATAALTRSIPGDDTGDQRAALHGVAIPITLCSPVASLRADEAPDSKNNGDIPSDPHVKTQDQADQTRVTAKTSKLHEKLHLVQESIYNFFIESETPSERPQYYYDDY